MKIYLTRHGETDWNILKKACGSTDRPLTENGLHQAEELARTVKGQPIDLVIASPLQRAWITAQKAAEALNVPLLREPRLVEIDYGDFEGIDRTLDAYRAIRGEPAMRYPNGESMFDVAARVYPFLDEIPKTYPGKNVLLVCHGAIGRIIDAYYHDNWTMKDLMNWQIANCELVEYDLP